MAKMNAPDGVAVWVNEDRCKGCDICVSVCPAGVLGMGIEKKGCLEKWLK